MDTNKPGGDGAGAGGGRKADVSLDPAAQRKRLREVNVRMSQIRTEMEAHKVEVDKLRSALKQLAKDGAEHAAARARLKQIVESPRELREKAAALRAEKQRLREPMPATKPAG